MNLQERDHKHIWHPLTQHQTAEAPIAIVKAKGALLWDEDGKEYIDGISSWYTAMYGHCNDYIVNAVQNQMTKLDQIVFSGFTHEPAIRLSELLMEILPSNQQKIFFNDNGSTAVEAGIKMAIQYHHNKGERRDTLIAFDNGFHGDTFAAMSVSGISDYNGAFEDFFLKVKRIPVPNKENIDEIMFLLKSIILENKCAAFIYEPLVQGAAGMTISDEHGLNEILKICNSNGIITIADEVMTGFGKTGRNFASDYVDTKPDIICLAKALTAGMMSMSITSCTQSIFDAFLDNDMHKGFLHAHTYSANPLACAAAIAGIELLLKQETKASIARISMKHQSFGDRIVNHEKVENVRQMGVIFALDLKVEADRYGVLRDILFKHFLDEGVFLRPLGNTIYILPPYVISDLALDKIYESIEASLLLV